MLIALYILQNYMINIGILDKNITKSPIGIHLSGKFLFILFLFFLQYPNQVLLERHFIYVRKPDRFLHKILLWTGWYSITKYLSNAVRAGSDGF